MIRIKIIGIKGGRTDVKYLAVLVEGTSLHADTVDLRAVEYQGIVLSKILITQND